MSAFDKLQSYSANNKNGSQPSQTPLFDISTPSGYFLNTLHYKGFKMFDENNEPTELQQVLTCNGDQLILSGAGSGKALVNGTRVLTPKGYKKIEDLVVGDLVIGSDGKSHPVLGVFPQGSKQVYEVLFLDGSVIECCQDHLWSVDIKGKIETTSTLGIERLLGRHDWLALPPLTQPKEGIDCSPEVLYFVRNCFLETVNEEEVQNLINTIPTIPDKDSSMIFYFDAEAVDSFNGMLEKLKPSDAWSYHTYTDGSLDLTIDAYALVDCYKDILEYSYECRLQYLKYELMLHGVDNTPHKNLVVHLSASELPFFKRLLDSLSLVWHMEVGDTFEESDKYESEEDFHKRVKGDFYTYQNRIDFYYSVQRDYKLIVSRFDYADNDNYIEKAICNVIKREEYKPMTCISVDSPDKLFVIENFILTHNTTALVFKVMLDIITGEATKVISIPNGEKVRVVDSILVSTFLKSGAEELQDRLAEWQRKLGYVVTADKINFSTLHAEFKRALNTMGVATPLMRDSESFQMLKKAIDSVGVRREGSPLVSDDYFAIQGIITYMRNRLDNKRYAHPLCREYDLSPMLLDRIVADYSIQKKMANKMDFEDLQELLYQYLYITPNPAVQDFIANRYKFIYIDEFQDTSQIQYAVLKFYARGRLALNKSPYADEEARKSQLYKGIEDEGKIVVIGDDDQAIYGWRGSDVDIICSNYESDFSPNITSLSYNYRCPSNILNPIIKSIQNNKKRHKKELKSAKEGGIFNAYHFTNINNMLKQFSKDIESDREANMQSTIICRTNFDGMIPAFMLEMEHKYDFSISNDKMTLNSPLPKKILAVTSLFTEKSTPAVKNTLSMFVPRFAEWKVKEVVDVFKSNSLSIWTISMADLSYSCPELIDIVEDLRSIVLDDNGKRDKKKEIEALKYIYSYISCNCFGGSSSYCEGARAYIDALLFLLDYKEFDTIFDFVEEVQGYNDRLQARIRKKKVPITIATVHEYKGKERDSIYIWNDSDGVFPSSKCDENNEDEFEEERRVHYIACTRAKKKSTIYALKGNHGRFLNEMQVEVTDPIGMKVTLKKNGDNSINESIVEHEKNMDALLGEMKFNDVIPDV